MHGAHWWAKLYGSRRLSGKSPQWIWSLSGTAQCEGRGQGCGIMVNVRIKDQYVWGGKSDYEQDVQFRGPDP
jgi:hypothetical protein